MSIGCLAGALSGAYTADWWGRRRSMSFGVAIFIIGNIIQITAMNSWIHMMMGRLVAGLGVGNLSVGVPMFQSESSPREIRGAVVASYQLMITVSWSLPMIVGDVLNRVGRLVSLSLTSSTTVSARSRRPTPPGGSSSASVSPSPSPSASAS